MEPLSPWLGVAGGVLIGGAAAALLLLSGRIAGVSGILASALGIVKDAAPWKQAAAFIVGLPIGALLIALFIREPRVEFTSSEPASIPRTPGHAALKLRSASTGV